MKFRKKIIINFDLNEEIIIKDFENLLDKVCTRIKMTNCVKDCPFYRICQQKDYDIKESFQKMIDSASEVYDEDNSYDEEGD